MLEYLIQVLTFKIKVAIWEPYGSLDIAPLN